MHEGVRMLRRTVLTCSGLLVGLAVMVLAGWMAGNDYLTAVLPGYVSMKANTATGFLVAGLAMALHSYADRAAEREAAGAEVWGGLRSAGLRRWARGLGLATFCWGGLSVAEYAFGVDLHIDQLLFVDRVQVLHPGRMALVTAINFCLAGLSLLEFGSLRRNRRISRVIALVLTLESFAAIVGFFYGAEVLYGSMKHNTMAFHTGAAFVVLGVGLVLLDSESRLVRMLCTKTSGGVLLRRSLPGVVLVPAVLGWLYLSPGMNFGGPRFGMALFAVTLGCVGMVAVWSAAVFLTRSEEQRDELARVREESSVAVRKSERELRLVTDHLPTLLSYIDTEWRYVRVNRTYEHWLGRPAGEIVGKTVWELLGPTFWERTAGERARALAGDTVTFETMYPTVRGERHAEMTYAPDKEELGEVRGIVCMVLDLHQRRAAKRAAQQSAELKRVNQSLQRIAVTDQLTGLKNRGALEARLRSGFAYATGYGKELSVLMLDIDDFKARNDTWGHASGDEVLRRMGAILAATVRVPDMAARYGGEEFCVLLPESSAASARIVAERIREALAKENWSEGTVTLSIGLAALSEEMEEAADLLQRADEALYEAKRTGKNRVCEWGEAGVGRCRRGSGGADGAESMPGMSDGRGGARMGSRMAG